ncbi:MAG: hypothetical protein K1X57_19055 [Gemmataceae bacterium]|nr:hypothetical protein [Gemmataceae bacterium]
MSDEQTDDAERQYAERLATLPAEEQRKALDLIRAPADDKAVPKRDRESARLRADAIERHLKRLKCRRKRL